MEAEAKCAGEGRERGGDKWSIQKIRGIMEG